MVYQYAFLNSTVQRAATTFVSLHSAICPCRYTVSSDTRKNSSSDLSHIARMDSKNKEAKEFLRCLDEGAYYLNRTRFLKTK